MDPISQTTPEEREAILLRFRMKHPEAEECADPSPEEAETLLLEIRERTAAIEAEALKMLSRATRNPASRSGLWSRHAQLAVLFLFVPLVLLGALWAVASILKYFFDR